MNLASSLIQSASGFPDWLRLVVVLERLNLKTYLLEKIAALIKVAVASLL